MSTASYELDPHRGIIQCGGVQFNLDKWTFSFTCLYCEQEQNSFKQFAEHFQQHIVMTEAETENAQKTVEEDMHSTDGSQEALSQTTGSVAQDGKTFDYEVEMLDDVTEESVELLDNESEGSPFVYQVKVLGKEDLAVPVESTDSQQLDNNDTSYSEEYAEGGPDLGFALVPNDVENVTANTNEPSYVCEICSMKFTQEATLQIHRQRHNRCQLCEINFPSKAQLKLHIQSHADQDTYVCDDCGESFIDNAIFTVHCKAHANDQLHVCNTCGKNFPDKRVLHDHIKTHTSSRPFVCIECNMTFSRQNALSLHASMHTDIRKFNCTICRMTFAQNSGLTAHMLDKHRNHTDDGADSK